MKGNSGIHITGGHVTVEGNMAAGNNAHAEIVAASWQLTDHPRSIKQLNERLGALVAELLRHRDDLPDAEQATKIASQVAAELKQPKPRQKVVVDLLNTMADGIAAVTGLAGTVEPLIRAARALL